MNEGISTHLPSEIADKGIELPVEIHEELVMSMMFHPDTLPTYSDEPVGFP